MDFFAQTTVDNVWSHVVQISPIVLIVLAMMMTRIIKVFTSHQQKMAEILNRSNGEQTEIAALRQEISELRSVLNTQVIERDGRQSAPPPSPEIADRLRTNA